MLSHMLSKETHAGTRDNICGAVAKMIITNPTAIPLDQVLIVKFFHFSINLCNFYLGISSFTPTSSIKI